MSCVQVVDSNILLYFPEAAKNSSSTSWVVIEFQNIPVTNTEIFWEYRFQQGISGQKPKRT